MQLYFFLSAVFDVTACDVTSEGFWDGVCSCCAVTIIAAHYCIDLSSVIYSSGVWLEMFCPISLSNGVCLSSTSRTSQESVSEINANGQTSLCKTLKM